MFSTILLLGVYFTHGKDDPWMPRDLFGQHKLQSKDILKTQDPVNVVDSASHILSPRKTANISKSYCRGIL